MRTKNSPRKYETNVMKNVTSRKNHNILAVQMKEQDRLHLDIVNNEAYIDEMFSKISTPSEVIASNSNNIRDLVRAEVRKQLRSNEVKTTVDILDSEVKFLREEIRNKNNIIKDLVDKIINREKQNISYSKSQINMLELSAEVVKNNIEKGPKSVPVNNIENQLISLRREQHNKYVIQSKSSMKETVTSKVINKESGLNKSDSKINNTNTESLTKEYNHSFH